MMTASSDDDDDKLLVVETRDKTMPSASTPGYSYDVSSPMKYLTMTWNGAYSLHSASGSHPPGENIVSHRVTLCAFAPNLCFDCIN